MDVSIETQRINNSTKRLLWLLVFCLSAWVAQAQKPASPSPSPTPSPKVSSNASPIAPSIPLKLNGQAPGTELTLFVSSDRQTTIFLTPTAPLPNRQYTI